MKRQSFLNRMTRHKRIRGGSGAAEYGVSTYGNMGEQHAMAGSGNLIATHAGGGKKRGGNFTKLAVPAALLYANQYFGSKSASQKIFKSAKKMGGSRRGRRSMRKRRSISFRKR